MSMEQFIKAKAEENEQLISISKECDSVDAVMVAGEVMWRKCCKWVLQKAGGNINLIDFMNEIAKEAGVNVVMTADGHPLVGDVTRLNLLRDEVLKAEAAGEERQKMVDEDFKKTGGDAETINWTDTKQLKLSKEQLEILSNTIKPMGRHYCTYSNDINVLIKLGLMESVGWIFGGYGEEYFTITAAGRKVLSEMK